MTNEGRQVKIINIAAFATNPGNLRVMLNKAWKRIADKKVRHDEWCMANESDVDELANRLDSRLWDEAQGYFDRVHGSSKRILETVPDSFGSGGFFKLLYFLVRLKKPKIVLETGVSAGWCSAAILNAMEKNGLGHLYSSDFPHFRERNPERYIGILIDDSLRHRWTLCTKGDEICIDMILRNVDHIDLLHYDSDKTYSGRQFVINKVKNKLRGPVVMDDIGDNSFFKDYCGNKHWVVLPNELSHVGLIW